MKYLDEINELEKKLEENKKNLDEIQSKKDQTIKTAMEKLNLNYTDKINQNFLEKNKIIERAISIKKLIEQYSTFNRYTLGQVLAEMTSIYKQEEYVSYLATIEYYICYDNHLPIEGLMITPTYDKKEEFSDMYIDDHNDQLIALVDYYKVARPVEKFAISLYNTITIYEYDIIIQSLHTNIVYNNDINNPKNVIFIKEFIDYVINYRIENKIDDISLEELEKLKDEFINNHQVEIEEYHKNNNLTLKREK